jgi:hypothetical protein
MGWGGSPKSKLFTKRHYVAIADLLSHEVQTGDRDLFTTAELANLVDKLAILFAKDNPAFKPETFRKAVYRDGGS